MNGNYYLHIGYPNSYLVGPFESLEKAESYRKDKDIGNFRIYDHITTPNDFEAMRNVDLARIAWKKAVAGAETEDGFSKWFQTSWRKV